MDPPLTLHVTIILSLFDCSFFLPRFPLPTTRRLDGDLVKIILSSNWPYDVLFVQPRLSNGPLYKLSCGLHFARILAQRVEFKHVL